MKKKNYFAFFPIIFSILLSACSTQEQKIDNQQPVSGINMNQWQKISENFEFTKVINSPTFGILGIDKLNQLLQFQNNKWNKLMDGVNSESKISASNSKIVVASISNNLMIYENQKVQTSPIIISPYADVVFLGISLIAVIFDNSQYKLARIEYNDYSKASSINKNFTLSPYTNPVQVNLSQSGDNSNGHIAVLATPTNEYSHQIAGNSSNNKSIFYVERHDLNDYLATTLTLETDDVFEDNTLRIWKINNKNQLVLTRSNNKQGAQIVVIENENKQLKILATGSPIGQGNRWMSAMIDQKTNQLFVNNTPHIGGPVYEYFFSNGKIQTKQISHNISFHSIGESQLATAALFNQKLFARSNLSLKTLIQISLNNLKTDSYQFNENITNIVTNTNGLIILLSNGFIYHNN